MTKSLSSGPSRLWYDTVDPGLSETNIDVFNWWLNTNTGVFFSCLDNTPGSQAWEQIVVQGDDISTGNINIANGSSITFSGESALSHYVDQMPFTPTIVGSSSAGVGTYTLQQGYYSRIGNLVTFALEITWTNHTGTGDLWIGNMPFNCRNSANYSPEAIINTQNMNLPGNQSRTAIGSAVSGSNHIIVVVPMSGGANSPVQMQTSGNIHCTIAYVT